MSSRSLLKPLISPVVMAGLFLLPLFYPGLWQTNADLLPKRLALCALSLTLCALWVFISFRLPTWRPNPLIWPAAIYVLINLLSLFWAQAPFTGFVEAAQLVILFVVFLCITQQCRNTNLLPFACWATLGGSVVSVIGIAQYLGLGFTHMLSVGLPSATFIFRNFAAAYIIAVLPLSLFAFVCDSAPKRRLLWMFCGTLMGLYLIYTRTRGAWLGLAIALIFGAGVAFNTPLCRNRLIALAKHSTTKWGIGLCFTLLILGATQSANTPVGVVQRFDELKDTTMQTATSAFQAGGDRGRFTMWRHTLTMIADHPFLGVGLDNWEYHYPFYDHGDKITEHSEPARPHNDLLWIASELGLPGLAIYLYLLGMAFCTGFRTIQTEQTHMQWAALSAMMGLIALFGDSLFSFPKEQPISSFFFWFHLSILGILSAKPEQPQSIVRIGATLGLVICVLSLHLNIKNLAFSKAYQQAEALSLRQQWPVAITTISEGLKQGTFDHRAQFLLGRYYQRANQYPQAEAAYLQGLKTHPNYAHTHHNLGGVYAAQKKWPQAIASYQKALVLRPGYYQVHINLGRAYVDMGQIDIAVETFQQVLKTHPQNVEAHIMIGAISLQKNDPVQAIAFLQEAVRLDPQNVQALNNLALSYELAGQTQLALTTYETLLKNWRGPADYRNAILLRMQTLHKAQDRP